MMPYKSRRAGKEDSHRKLLVIGGQLSVYYGLLLFAQSTPIPPIPLLDGEAGITGLGNGAAKDIEAANIVLLAGSLTEPVIEFFAILPR
jgi:hypothetical protein